MKIPNLTAATERRLWDAFSKAELLYQLEGVPITETLRKEANRTLGQTRRELLRVASLGEGEAEKWMGKFIEAMQE